MNIPDKQYPIHATADKGVAVFAEVGNEHSPVVPAQGIADLHAAFHIPEDNRAVETGCNQLASVGAEAEAVYVAGVPVGGGIAPFVGFNVPEDDVLQVGVVVVFKVLCQHKGGAIKRDDG